MWRLDKDQAFFSGRCGAVRLELTRPDRGLRDLIYRDQRPSGEFLQLAFSWIEPTTPALEIADAYVRDEDLVVSYRPNSAGIHAQLYWRPLMVADERGGLCLELWISVQTDFLDSDPRVATTSLIPHATAWRMTSATTRLFAPCEVPSSGPIAFSRQTGPGVLLVRAAQEPWCYAEMVHPLDFGDARLEPTSDSCRWGFLLLSDRLEKGVLRRARLRFLWAPRAEGEALTRLCYEDFVHSRLPLTA